MKLALSAVAQVVEGRLQPPTAADFIAQAVEIDTRRLTPQSLFVALRGQKRDGHEFLPAAAAAGAVAAIVCRLQKAAALPQIIVDDAQAALWRLARSWRRQYRGRIAAITGSNGKTTVKEMLRCIMAAALGEEHVLASAGNFNNHLGVPLTLLKLQPHHTMAVLEAGMDHAGELTELSALIQPHVVVINNAQRAHIGHFASLTAIARAKAELLSALPSDGIAVLNADDAHFPLWQQLAGQRQVLSFGRAAAATLRAQFSADGIVINDEKIILQVPGEHNKQNALAAAAAALALQLPMEAVTRGLAAYGGVSGRLSATELSKNILLIDDTYNANPESAAAALMVLVETAAQRQAQPLLVMGDMLALGSAAADAHSALVAACREQSVLLLGIGEQMQAAVGGEGGHVGTREALVRQVSRLAAQHNKLCILVKGSRGMHMEDVVADIKRMLTPEKVES